VPPGQWLKQVAQAYHSRACCTAHNHAPCVRWIPALIPGLLPAIPAAIPGAIPVPNVFGRLGTCPSHPYAAKRGCCSGAWKDNPRTIPGWEICSGWNKGQTVIRPAHVGADCGAHANRVAAWSSAQNSEAVVATQSSPRGAADERDDDDAAADWPLHSLPPPRRAAARSARSTSRRPPLAAIGSALLHTAPGTFKRTLFGFTHVRPCV
jgi:hypothetical protein